MKRILVIGDAIQDVYRHCDFKKMCPDAPAVEAIVIRSTKIFCGGAANVAVNIAALSENVLIDFIGVLNTDFGRRIKTASNGKVNISYSVQGEPLTKERFFSGDELKLRVDNSVSVHTKNRSEIREKLQEYFDENNPDLIVLSDYGSGTVGYESLFLLMKYREKLLVDTKIDNLSLFSVRNRSYDTALDRTFLIKLNDTEWKAAVKHEPYPEKHFNSMIVTHGEHGASIISYSELPNGRIVTNTLAINGIKSDTVDVCGCGDTFMAGLATGIIDGEDIYSASMFANAAASTVVSKKYTAIADRDLTLEILKRKV